MNAGQLLRRPQIQARKLNLAIGVPEIAAAKAKARRPNFLSTRPAAEGGCVKFWAAHEGYELGRIYDSLVEQGVRCHRWPEQVMFRVDQTFGGGALASSSSSCSSDSDGGGKKDNRSGGRSQAPRHATASSCHTRSRSADCIRSSWKTLVHETSGADDLECIVFKIGTVVVFGLKPTDVDGSNLHVVHAIASYLRQFASGDTIRPDWTSTADTVKYTVDWNGKKRVVRDTIVLRSETDADEKLAVAMACSQSCQLAIYEESLKTTVTQLLQTKLVSGGWDPESDYTMKALGDLYADIIDINMVLKLLDVPEHFWENPTHQNLWLAVHQYLEVKERVAILNTRCDSLREMLGDMAQNRNLRRETRLTWICIGWIVVYILVLVVEQRF